MFAGEGHEGDAAPVLIPELVTLSFDHPKGLVGTRRAYGDNQTAAILQLLEEGRRYVIWGAGDDDTIIGSMLFPAIVAV